MNRSIAILRWTTLVPFLLLSIAAQGVDSQTAESPTIRVTSKEVLLDAVVRDKKGHVLHKLKAEDFEVRENGVRRQISGFREISGVGSASSTSPAGGKAAAGVTNQVRLVSLVFQRLGVDARKIARQGALDLLKNEEDPAVYYGVFYIDYRLKVVQTFTRDRELAKAAVEKATGISNSDFVNDNSSLRLAGDATSGASGASEATASAAASSRGAAPVDGGSLANEQMNRMVQDMADFSDMLSREQEGRNSIFPLWAIIQEQSRLPGRKAVIYFSEGLQLPNSLWSPFLAMISAANRANVSVYAVDARGLRAGSDQAAASAELRTAAANGYSQWSRSTENGPVRRSDVMILDNALDSLRANTQNALAELAESTGGALIANTNDVRAPLKRVSEELNSHYEISYRPENETYDGRFHEIAVIVNRSQARVQTRNGYFSLPPVEGQVVFPYEVPLLNAVTKTPLPHAFDFQAAVRRFRPEAGGWQASLIFDLPLKNITFKKLEDGKSYRTHASVLALVKDAQGRVVAKLSRDVPVEEPLNKLDGFSQGRFIVTRTLHLAPGRYTVESAVADREGERISAKRAALVFPAMPSGIALSAITMIRRFDRVPESPEPGDPYITSTARIVPTLLDAVPGGKNATLSLYFLIYPDKDSPDKPELLMQFLQDETIFAQGSPALPAADAHGVIPYVAKSPIENLKPGQYEIRVTVKQGNSTAQESAFVTIE